MVGELFAVNWPCIGKTVAVTQGAHLVHLFIVEELLVVTHLSTHQGLLICLEHVFLRAQASTSIVEVSLVVLYQWGLLELNVLLGVSKFHDWVLQVLHGAGRPSIHVSFL